MNIILFILSLNHTALVYPKSIDLISFRWRWPFCVAAFIFFDVVGATQTHSPDPTYSFPMSSNNFLFLMLRSSVLWLMLYYNIAPIDGIEKLIPTESLYNCMYTIILWKCHFSFFTHSTISILPFLNLYSTVSPTYLYDSVIDMKKKLVVFAFKVGECDVGELFGGFGCFDDSSFRLFHDVA